MRLKINSLWLKVVPFVSMFIASGLLIFPPIKIRCTFREKPLALLVCSKTEFDVAVRFAANNIS